ncbi:hypothetical protein [Agrobacterium tumefaciens]|uniref:hypothetical protein n=1 Tax=Agrobacterium tumefaciens TaxID=358 RepID=UPI001CBC9806|nr:hypothetical protein [Agrobacterium tumefaciens]
MNWNHDLSQAPRGKMAPTTVKAKDGVKQSETYQREYIIAAGHCGAVTKSYWIPEQERWCMFTKDVPPGAWMPWPDNPFQAKANDEACETVSGLRRAEAKAEASDGVELVSRVAGGRTPAATSEGMDVTGGESAATQFYLEDVGGGA